MKLHLKLTSVLLSAVMCASMVMAPVSVIADETTAPSETQTAETTEKEQPKETKQSPKETEKKEPEITKKSEAAETKETAPEEKKPTESVKETEPAETEDKKPAETTETEPAQPSEKEPAESKEEEPSNPDETEPSQTTKPDEEDVPETTVNPEAGGMDETHSVPPKNAGAYKEGDISGTTGSGASESDPVICDNFAEFKAAMENTEIKYVKLSGASEVIPSQSTLAAAIEQTTSKTLIIAGYNTFTAPLNGFNDCLIWSCGDLFIKGTGSLEYEHGNSSGHGAVIYQQYGLLQIESGVTLKGSANGGVFGRALYIDGGTTRINGGNFIGYLALQSSGDIDAVCVNSGSVSISGGNFYSTKHYSVSNSIKAYGIYISGGTLKLSGGTYYGIDSSKSRLSELLNSGYSYIKGDKSIFDGSTVKTTLETLTVAILIEKVNLTISAPEAGKTPNDMTPSVDGGLNINGRWWFPQHNAQGGSMSGTEAFVNGNSYSSAYRIEIPSNVKKIFAVTVNVTATTGTVYKVNRVNDNAIEVIVNHPKLISTDEETSILSVSVTIDAPTAGANPDYTAVFPSGVKYYSDAYNDDNFRNDIYWYDIGIGKFVDPDSGVFEAGHAYRVAVYLTAKSGCSFKNNTTATLNGEKAETLLTEDGQLKVTYTFAPLVTTNTLSVKPKTAKVKYKKLRKKKQTVARSKVMTVSNPQGNVTYKLIGVKRGKSKKYKKYFKINATTGNVSIKKKLRKGTYKITCTVTASGNSEYKSGTKTVTFKIKVK